MKLFKKKLDERQIAIKFMRELSDEDLEKFKKAVDYYREGDRLQAEYYEKGDAEIAFCKSNEEIQ